MDSKEAGKMQTIEIDKLNVQQLSQMKQQLDQEVGLFNDSLQQLKVLYVVSLAVLKKCMVILCICSLFIRRK